MVYDLHAHSTASDGRLSPTELVHAAAAAGVSALALTDHDTVQGIAEARAAAPPGLRLIAGVEISALWRGRCVHILGLNVREDEPDLLAALALQERARDERGVRIGAALQRQNLPDVLAAAEREAHGGALGRPHFARALVAVGAVKDENEAFKKYLGAGKAGDVTTDWLSLEQAVDVIARAGGSAVLAHPSKYKLTRTKLLQLVGDFQRAGGAGLEARSGDQAAPEVRDLCIIAAKHELTVSCGSDFHTPDNPWRALGKSWPLPPAPAPVWSLW